jgi:hypothetical protein
MDIEILERTSTGYEVRVVTTNGRTIRVFTYPTIESARKAAAAWTVAYGNCPVVDKSGAQ